MRILILFLVAYVSSEGNCQIAIVITLALFFILMAARIKYFTANLREIYSN